MCHIIYVYITDRSYYWHNSPQARYSQKMVWGSSQGTTRHILFPTLNLNENYKYYYAPLMLLSCKISA